MAAVIEKKNFGRLKLRVSCLDEGEDVIFGSGNQLVGTTEKLHDPKHGWVGGKQVAAPVEYLVRCVATL